MGRSPWLRLPRSSRTNCSAGRPGRHAGSYGGSWWGSMVGVHGQLVGWGSMVGVHGQLVGSMSKDLQAMCA